MANNQNFIVKHGLTVGSTNYVIDTNGNWVGPDTPYANAAFARANSKTQTYVQASAPSSPSLDDIWIDTTSGIEYTYVDDVSGPQWVEFGPIGSPTGNITFSDQTITGSVSNRDITIFQQGTGNIVLQSANTYIIGNLIANAPGKKAEFNNISAVYFRVNTSTTIANSAAVNIVASTGYYTQSPTSNGYMIQCTGYENTTTRVVVDSASTGGTAYSAFIGRHARGTHQYPTASQNGDMLARFSGNGFGSSGYGVSAGGASIDIYATENYTDTARGAKLVVSTTNLGTNTRIQVATFQANNITLTGNVIANAAGYQSNFHDVRVEGSLIVNTAILTANTTQYINYSDVSLILVDVTGTTTFVHQNFRTGSSVKVIAHNNTGSDHTINLSVSSLNCTATRDKNGKYNAPANSITIFAGTTACYDFISFDGNLANTYCVITPT